MKHKLKFFLLLLTSNSVVNSFMLVDFDKSMNISDHHKIIQNVPVDLTKLSPLFANSKVIMQRGELFKKLFKAMHVNHKINLENKTKIPKIMHHIWIGGELPNNFKFCIASCKKHHPDWEHHLWTDADLDRYDWRFKDILKAKNVNPGTKSDILRLEVLFKHGGVYLDTDFFCCKPLDKLHETVDFYGCVIDEWYSVANGVIGAAAGHKLIGMALDALKPNGNHDDNNIMLTTGPYFLTTQIVNYINNYPVANIVVLPRSYFFAMSADYRYEFWKGAKNLNFAKQFEQPETLAIHLWATSWQSHSSSKKNILYDVLKKQNLCFVESQEPVKLIQARRLKDGATSLIAAIREITDQENLLYVVELLGRNGADFEAKDVHGYDALYYAKNRKYLELVKLIKAYS